MGPPWTLGLQLLSLILSATCAQESDIKPDIVNFNAKLKSSGPVVNFRRPKNGSTNLFKNLEDDLKTRPKRSKRRNRACQMLIAIDEPLYRTFNSDMDQITKLATNYVKELNNIYHRTFLKDNYGDIYFRIKEIRILFDFCLDCNQTQAVYLAEFSKFDTSKFCLAHVFTYRDFPAGVQGLAWKSSICKRKFNTGFTTLLNHGNRASDSESIMTFAHEVGHNFGAPHDQDVNCPDGYIMSESGSKRNIHEHTFSSCSLEKMDNEMKIVQANIPKCFVNKDQEDEDDFSTCGNFIVEGDEECDCGLDFRMCSDPCCYAARIDPADVQENKTAVPCRRNSKYDCSHPYHTVWQYGFVAPWITILVVTTVTIVALIYDWKHNRLCYKHVTLPKELIRSETFEQMEKRINRQQSAENNRLMQNVYSVDGPRAQRVQRPSNPPPQPPRSLDYTPSAPPRPPAKDYPKNIRF